MEMRRIDAEQLKALAHPLRYQLLDALTQRGPATASQLAEQLGESSGATSYHLRQLAKHGFIEEVPGRGSGRERWWQRVPGGITIEGFEYRQRADTRDAALTVGREIQRVRDERRQRWLAEGGERWSKDWVQATLDSDAHLILTSDELAELQRTLIATVTEYAERSDQRREDPPPGSAHVEVQVYLFPTDPAGPAGDAQGE